MKDNERVVCENRKARHEYDILETLECGIVLVGSEVRSLRSGNVSLEEAYARVKAAVEPAARSNEAGRSVRRRGAAELLNGGAGAAKRSRKKEKANQAGRSISSVGPLSQSGEVWLLNCDIAEYPEANMLNHKPKRPRKLLLHRSEIRKFAAKAYEKGLTLVPLRILFSGGKAKVLLGLCRGKQLHDKRDTKKRADNDRYLARFMMKRR
ncbi:MAG: SsrA-binding protein [Thermoguttaceae bacterium]|nr:SsrA-binding protein [Thermoguttaceae bacterium]